MGNVTTHWCTLQIPLEGPNSVVGRALVIHELEDDLGKGELEERAEGLISICNSCTCSGHDVVPHHMLDPLGL